MSADADSMYRLLPAVYRINDERFGGPLRALVGVLASQASIVEDDIAQLYRNWFIETCDEWAVAYIGDLVGVRGLHPVSQATFSLRARVANTLAYRRRKGTAAMLEQLARDSTGWTAHAVEFFELLGTAQHLNHLRPRNLATPDLRRTAVLELLDSPFDTVAHSVDVRHIASNRGRHNIPNVGIFLWQLKAFPLAGVTACAVANPPDGRFTFSPLGIDAPLFNAPEPEREITHLAEEINVPAPLRRRSLYDELEARRRALALAEEPKVDWFDDDPVVRIQISGKAEAIKPEEILVCDLSDWHKPAAKKTYHMPDGSTVDMPIKVAIDPNLGRLTFPAAARVQGAFVDYAYGFSGDLGAGPYDRTESVRALRALNDQTSLLDSATWHAGVSQTRPSVANTIFSSLSAAVDEWNIQPAGTIGCIALLDSRTYEEDLTAAARIRIPLGSQLLIYAADLPIGAPVATAIATECRPHLKGNLSVEGTGAGSTEALSELVLNGLLIEGKVTVLNGQLGSLRIEHCTVVPGKGKVVVNGSNPELVVRLARCICGTIELPPTVTKISIGESVVHGEGGVALEAPDSRADLRASTFFGTVRASGLEAENSIFMSKVDVARLQDRCVRFCWLPESSSTPRRYRCQPELALLATSDVAVKKQIRARLVPSFTSIVYGQPGYGQLAVQAPIQIRNGADDGAEMGALQFLKRPQREQNLRSALSEYLRFGLEAGVLYVT